MPKELTQNEISDLETIADDLGLTDEDVSKIIRLTEQNPNDEFEYKGYTFVNDNSGIDTDNMSWASVDSQFGDWVIFYS